MDRRRVWRTAAAAVMLGLASQGVVSLLVYDGWLKLTRPPDSVVPRPHWVGRDDLAAARDYAERLVTTLAAWAGEDWFVLDWPPSRMRGGDFEFQLYSASALANHPTGRIEPGAWICVEPSEPRLTSFSAELMLEPLPPKIDSADARLVAERFCETYVEAAKDPRFEVEIRVSQRAKLDNPHRVFEATIEVRQDGVELPYGAELKIEAGKGAIVEAWLQERAQPLPPPDLTPTEAAERARRAIRRRSEGEPVIESCELQCGIQRGRPWPFYRLTLVVPSDEGGQHAFDVNVDAQRGKASVVYELDRPAPDTLVSACGAHGHQDYSPVWGRLNGRDVVLFLSERSLKGDSRPYRDETTVMMADLETGQLTCVLPVEEWRFCLLLGGGDQIAAIEVGDDGVDGYVLDLAHRRYRRLPGCVRGFYQEGIGYRADQRALVGRAWRVAGGEVDRARVYLDSDRPQGIQWLPSEPGLDSWAVYDEAGGYEYRPFQVSQEGNTRVFRLKRRPLDSAEAVPWQPCSPQIRDYLSGMDRLGSDTWLLQVDFGWLTSDAPTLLHPDSATTELWRVSLPDKPREWDGSRLRPARATVAPDGRRMVVEWHSVPRFEEEPSCSMLTLMTADGQFIRRLGDQVDQPVPVKAFKAAAR